MTDHNGGRRPCAAVYSSQIGLLSHEDQSIDKEHGAWDMDRHGGVRKGILINRRTFGCWMDLEGNWESVTKGMMVDGVVHMVQDSAWGLARGFVWSRAIVRARLK